MQIWCGRIDFQHFRIRNLDVLLKSHLSSYTGKKSLNLTEQAFLSIIQFIVLYQNSVAIILFAICWKP